MNFQAIDLEKLHKIISANCDHISCQAIIFFILEVLAIVCRTLSVSYKHNPCHYFYFLRQGLVKLLNFPGWPGACDSSTSISKDPGITGTHYRTQPVSMIISLLTLSYLPTTLMSRCWHFFDVKMLFCF